MESRGTRMKTLRRWLLRGCLACVVLLVLVGGVFYARYPGFVRDSMNMWRRSDRADIADLYSYMLYYTDYFSRITKNPETGIYDMEGALLESGDQDPFEHGMLCFHAGRHEDAVKYMQRGIEEQGETEHRLFWLGLAYQRVAEQNNCAAHCKNCDEAARFCSLPIVSIHQDMQPSRQAVDVFKKLLDNYDSDNGLYRWLLNFSYMTLGEYPAGVSDRYRISGKFTDAFHAPVKSDVASAVSQLSFRECASEMHINTDDAGKGVAVEDFNRDGYLDIITGGTFQVVRYYRNDGGKTFVDATEEAGLGGIIQPFIITSADYDNDGWVDLFVSRPFHHFLLLRNENGVFKDVTFTAGLLPGPPKPDEIFCTCMSAWGDVNNDGYLDLFLAQLGQRFPLAKGLLARTPASSRLYLNVAADEQGGQERGFIDATRQFGLDRYVNDQIFFGAAFGDYDDDGWTDLFISSPVLARSTLLHNERGQKFVRSDAMTTIRGGFTAAFLDINHDGRLDMFHGGHGPAKRNVERAVFGKGSSSFSSAVFVQDEGGRFEERTDLFRDAMPIGTMGTSFGDFNNDGAFEFYLGTGNPEPSFVLPNVMYLGEIKDRQPTGTMSNITMTNGFGTIQKGHGIVFFDFDKDGDQDMYSSLGGMWPGDAWPNQFFKNESDLKNTWVKIRLRGRASNYYGVGAMIEVVAETADDEPVIRYYYMNNKMGFGSAPYLAHIGLMDAARIVRVDVRWPATREIRSYEAQIGQLNVLDENGQVTVGEIQPAAAGE